MKNLGFLLLCLILFSVKAQEGNTVELSVKSSSELSYGFPSQVGLDSSYIHKKVDSIMAKAIKNMAFPGAQVLVAKEAQIIFHKAFGYHTYDEKQKVGLNDLYDLASVTKIMAALPAVMKLVDEGKLNLDIPFSTYWKPWAKQIDKKDLTLREILAHQAGLTPYIVFLNEVKKKNGKLKRKYIRKKASLRFNKQAYDGLFVRNNFNKRMYRAINESTVGEKTYRYSGLVFLIFPELVERLSGQPFETYLREHFYTPLGVERLGFLPKLRPLTNPIVPTEEDTIYRHTLTKAWVHDENASLLGGISGNAGLFATATDLAKMMQMYLNFGSYAGQQFISEEILKEFIKVQYPDNNNRRGLGFDKPELKNFELSLDNAYPAPEVSAESFGHGGFTGTFVWADPKNQLVYIFLSNRVYPSREHRNLYTLNVRSAIQQVFYQATMKSK